MSDRPMIPNALTPEEWAAPHAPRGTFYGCVEGRSLTLADGSPNPRLGFAVDADDVPPLIALANAALPDNDPRKICRDWVEVLRRPVLHEGGCAVYDGISAEPRDCDCSQRAHVRALRSVADALASYLPPEK